MKDKSGTNLKPSSDDNGDLPASRLRTLRGIIRQLIYKHHGENVKERHVKALLSDIQPNELEVCLLIINKLMPYVPKKENFFIIAYQLPFFPMANQTLQSTVYSKFCAAISPMSTPNGLHTLNIDVPSLFALFCDSKTRRNMNIFDFRNKTITSRASATELKHAVFSSFFDIKAINSTCSSYGLDFAHTIHLLPKLKTARLTELEKSGSFTFSGTDNGLVTMTETVGFSLRRFKYHIDLYNRYSVLDEFSEEYPPEFLSSDYLKLPKSHSVHSSEISLKTGAKKIKKRLELREKNIRKQRGSRC
ncbi:hypothetical protein K501DRAFT_309053 [Backusella circina FSU 941]|nr:hypothetical protein K501DRAFT_309053 [Backusella circina FSU 941]